MRIARFFLFFLSLLVVLAKLESLSTSIVTIGGCCREDLTM